MLPFRKHSEIKELVEDMSEYFGEDIVPNPTHYPLSFRYYLRVYLMMRNADVMQKGE
jgi:hypothetical protein